MTRPKKLLHESEDGEPSLPVSMLYTKTPAGIHKTLGFPHRIQYDLKVPTHAIPASLSEPLPGRCSSMADWTAPMLSGLQHESPRPCHSTIGRYSLGLLGPREDRIPPRSFLPRSYLGRTSLGSAALHIARFDRSINSWTHARAANACCTRDVALCDCIFTMEFLQTVSILSSLRYPVQVVSWI